MSLHIAGIGTALPHLNVTQAESIRCARVLGGPALAHAKWLDAVYARSGVQSRHQALGRPLVDDLLNGTRHSESPFLPGPANGPSTSERMAIYAREAPPLAVQAARIACKRAGIDPPSVTHVITVSCTGFLAPGIDLALINELNLSPQVQRTHIGFMGCHGALNGLRVADALCRADPKVVVLLVAVELCSLHYSYGAEPDQVVANALFADGAAAIVGRARRESDISSVVGTGSCVIPESTGEMAWTVGDHGFTMTLTKRIPILISQHLRAWFEPWLRSHGLEIDDIQSWAVHPGGPKILVAVGDSLSLPHEALAPSRAVLSECGNMSSPTVLFILERFHKAGGLTPTVILGFGPGMAVESVLIR